MICPKCKQEVPQDDTCSACGVIVEKYKISIEKKVERELTAKVKASAGERIKSQKLKSLKRERPWPFRRVSDSALAEVLIQFSRMLASGISMKEALTQIQRNTEGILASSFGKIMMKVDAGETFSAALAVAPAIFSQRMRILVEVGEKTGELPSVLKGISEMLELRERIRRRIVMACLYPFFLLTFFFFSLPVVKLFTDGLGAYLLASLIPYAGTIAFIVGLLYILPLITEKLLGQAVYQRLLRNLPLIGKMYTFRSTLLFCQNLQIALNAGEELYTSLGLAAQSSGDIYLMKQIMSKTASTLQRGGSLEKALAETRAFDRDFILAISTGELSGNLDEVLEYHAEKTREKLVHKLEIFVWVTGMFVLVTVSIFIAYGIISEFQRILDLYESISTELNTGGSTADIEDLLKSLGGIQ